MRTAIAVGFGIALFVGGCILLSGFASADEARRAHRWGGGREPIEWLAAARVSAAITQATGWLTMLLSALGVVAVGILDAVESIREKPPQLRPVPKPSAKPRIDSAGDVVPPRLPVRASPLR